MNKKKTLQQRLTEICNNITHDVIDKEVILFRDYKSKYAVMKPSVIVRVEFTEGRAAEIDITDWFKGVVK